MPTRPSGIRKRGSGSLYIPPGLSGGRVEWATYIVAQLICVQKGRANTRTSRTHHARANRTLNIPRAPRTEGTWKKTESSGWLYLHSRARL